MKLLGNNQNSILYRRPVKIDGKEEASKALEKASMNNYGDVGVSAFEGCTALKVLEANNKGVIGTSAFSGCSALKSVTILSGAVTGETFLMAINNCPVEVVRIPAAFVDKFKETFTADISIETI